MNTLYIAVGGALLALLIGAGLMYRHDAGALAAKDAQIGDLTERARTLDKQRTADAATLASLAKNNATAARKDASARASLSAATASAPEWRDSPVPKEVQDALSE